MTEHESEYYNDKKRTKKESILSKRAESPSSLLNEKDRGEVSKKIQSNCDEIQQRMSSSQ